LSISLSFQIEIHPAARVERAAGVFMQVAFAPRSSRNHRLIALTEIHERPIKHEPPSADFS